MATRSCCTCATVLTSNPALTPPSYYTVDERHDESTPPQQQQPQQQQQQQQQQWEQQKGREQGPRQYPHEQSLGCCGRAICRRCLSKNPRFANYCPFCQISFGPSALPSGLRDPPTYSPPSSPPPPTVPEPAAPLIRDPPPSYDSSEENARTVPAETKKSQPAEDVLHFVNPDVDSVSSLSLRYGVPKDVLRRKNDLFADHLLTARRCILIPGEHYSGGVSFSPQPVDGEEEELRKGKIRRWMMACKVADYDIAQYYLKETQFNLDEAVLNYRKDEEWDKNQRSGPSSIRRLMASRGLRNQPAS